MRVKFCFLVFFIFASAVLPAIPTITAQKETLENEVFEIREVRLGDETIGPHLFSAVVTNRSEAPRNFAIDIRTESLGLGRANWQNQFFFRLNVHETRNVEAEYEIVTPLLSRVLLRFGESPEYDDWLRLPAEERGKTPNPKILIYWRKEFPAKTAASTGDAFRDSVAPYSLYLSSISPERLAQIKEEMPGLVKRSRTQEPLRKSLRDLIRVSRTQSRDFEYRDESWYEDSSRLDSIFENYQILALPFSISGEAGNRISAFVATRKVGASQKRPIIFLLSGNPPGTKESLVGTAIYFAEMGFHAVGIDRRETSRTLDTKEKFLTPGLCTRSTF